MNRSQTMNKIAEAMLKVQNEIKGMTPDAKNPFFKSNYITLDGILEYIRPILSNHQVWLLQEAKGLDSNVSVKTSLIHVSGEFIETESLEMVPGKSDPQVVGSLITYLKRYQLAALIGISSEVDDDGNKASGKQDTSKQSKKAADTAKPQVNINALTNTDSASTGSNGTADDILKCCVCKTDINKAVHDFSVHKFGRQLCVSCQKKEVKS